MLELEVDNLESVPEHLRQFYVQADAEEGEEQGKFKLNTDGVGKVLANYDRLLGEKKKLGRRLREFDEAGIDIERYQELAAAAEEAEAKASKSKGDWEAREKQLNQRHQKELESLRSETSALAAQLEDLLVDQEIANAVNGLGPAAPGAADLIIPFARRHVRMVKTDDGKRKAVVVDSEGTPRVGDSKGGDMTVSQFVKEEIFESERFARFFKDSGEAGGGTPPKSGTGGKPRTDAADLASLSPREKLARARKMAG